MSYKIVFTKNAVKDYELVKKSPYAQKVKKLLTIIESDPYRPPYEELRGNYDGLFSRHINRQHRLVYEIINETNTIKVRALWTHYENV